MKAKELLIEFLDVQWKLIRDVQPKSQVKWGNDWAIFSNFSLAGIGVMIWDSWEYIIVALSQKIMLPRPVELVEALIAKWIVSFAQELFIF